MENDVEKSINFNHTELEYILVILSEGMDKVNSSKAFEGYQDVKIQEKILDKIRNKCWEFHLENKRK